jgi:hypothetical protein
MVVILVDRHEAREVEHEEKVKWLRTVLENVGVPMEDWPDAPSMENLRKMRKLLQSVDIDILDDSNDGIEVYNGDKLIAEWRRPYYVLREDLTQRNERHRFYLEMHLKCRTVFEEEKEAAESNSLEEDDS